MKPCPKCLLEDLKVEELLITVQAYVRQLDPKEKATEAIYQERLAQCKACPHLYSGMCGKCGCYVQLRAAKALQKCPDVPARWTRTQKTQADDA